MTNHWVDIKNANLIVVMGGNAAEAHPVPLGDGSQNPQRREADCYRSALYAYCVGG
jgi:anaerobic selenocysteine-containing dehydrogenase